MKWNLTDVEIFKVINHLRLKGWMFRREEMIFRNGILAVNMTNHGQVLMLSQKLQPVQNGHQRESPLVQSRIKVR